MSHNRDGNTGKASLYQDRVINLLADVADVPPECKTVEDEWSIVHQPELTSDIFSSPPETMRCGTGVTGLCPSPDSQHLAMTCYEAIHVFNIETRERHRKLVLPGDGSQGV